MDQALFELLLNDDRDFLETVLLLDDSISDDDFLFVLFNIEDQNTNSGNGWADINIKPNFSLDNLPQPCADLFRFEADEIKKLAEIFFPKTEVLKPNRIPVHRVEAMCIVLRRLAYPNRWSDLVPLFGRHISVLSIIFKEAITRIHNRTKHLCVFNFERISGDVKKFAEAIHQKGSPYDRCFGFIDGTFRQSCRPTFNQKVAFSGHKRAHGIKFQGVTTPDGIVQEIFGPFPASRHDAGILQQSGLLQKLEDSCYINGQWYYLYGDPAYPLRPFLIPPFMGVLNAEKAEMNLKMSKVRQSVEWAFKDTNTLLFWITKKI